MTLSLLYCRCNKMSRSLQKGEPFDQRRNCWETTKQAWIKKKKLEKKRITRIIILIKTHILPSQNNPVQRSDVVQCLMSDPRLSAFTLPGFTSSLFSLLSERKKKNPKRWTIFPAGDCHLHTAYSLPSFLYLGWASEHLMMSYWVLLPFRYKPYVGDTPQCCLPPLKPPFFVTTHGSYLDSRCVFSFCFLAGGLTCWVFLGIKL